MKIISGSSNKALAQHIAKVMNLPLSPVEIFLFPDGERRVKLNDTVVDEDILIVQSTSTPVDEHYVELFFLIDSARRSGARSVTVVMPYFGYQRQDHVFRDGEAVSLEVMIRILESLKVAHVIAFDLHSIKIPEFFRIPITHLSALPLFAEEIQKRGWMNDESVLVSPDLGGLRRIQKMSDLLGNMPWIATVKDRDLDTGTIQINEIEGDKNNIRKRALIVDDMISSGHTIVESANLLRKHGVEEVYVFVTHPIFSQEAPKILQESFVNTVFVTDSVFVPEEKTFQKLQVLSIANKVKDTIEQNK